MKPARLPIESAGKKEKIDILLVDDLPANLLALEALLAGEGLHPRAGVVRPEGAALRSRRRAAA